MQNTEHMYSDLPATHYMIGPHQWQWIDALESGQYQQDKLQLQTSRGFCCLGVGAEISGCSYVPLSPVAPESVVDWLGLFTCIGGAKGLKLRPLAHLNDLKKWTFSQIAAHLRKFPYLYFSKAV